MYQYKEVGINLPGSVDYGPSMERMSKVWEDGRITADLFIYMDDFQMTGPDRTRPDAEECWRASRRAAITDNHLGIQDASMKIWGEARAPGPWAVSVIYMDDAEAGARVLVSRKKWTKVKRLLATLHGLVLASEWVDHNVLERIWGLLVFLVFM
jgi:hypothetical protein